MSNMRKILTIVFTIITCYANAQRHTFEQEISVGANAGATFSKVSFLHNNQGLYSKYLGDLGMKGGMKFGASARYISQKHFGVQLELNFLQAGWKEKFSEETYLNDETRNFKGLELKRRLDYVEIPLLAHIYFGKSFRYYFNVGPKVAFLINESKLKSSEPISTEDFVVEGIEDPRIDDNADYNKFDYGLVIGLGLEFKMAKTSAMIEGRYNFGFGDVYPNSKKELYQRSNNQIFSVTMAVLMPVLHFSR